jgi:UDP-N-acetylmuramate--alanine ligase
LTAFDLVELARRKPVHFMGIAGAGMSPLAELIRRSRGQVTGCDARIGSVARALRDSGIDVREGHDAVHLEGCSALVMTSAVRPDHPEVLAAREAGIPVLKRAEALGSIVNRGTVVGIAGTHGKTTTTALTTSALAAAGLNPTGLVGGLVPDWGGNLRVGGDLFVVEADEYDRSFHTLDPRIAVVTTLEADHLDIYGSLSGVEEAFADFVARVPEDGRVIACGDDGGVGRLLPRLNVDPAQLLTYGLSAGCTLRASDVETRGTEVSFRVSNAGTHLGTATIRVPGTHNVRNALAAIAVAREFDARWDDIATGLADYAGVARRFEHVGERAGVVLVDDYAHHPTEIRATLQAARSAFPGRRIVAAFQPHLYSRTRDFAEDFGHALAAADLVCITEIYAAREAPIPGITAHLIVEHARAAGAEVMFVPARAEVPRSVAACLRPGDVCLTLGAGDLDEAAREVLELLHAEA